METLEPWLPPEAPDLAVLAMKAADLAGSASVRAWPERRKGGIGFGDLPPFLCWRGQVGTAWHLVLVQPRELGSLVPGARIQPLPPHWLADLDLQALAGPLALHPDFPGGASVHVVHLPGGTTLSVRTHGTPAPELVVATLLRLSPVPDWRPRL
ncbi:MAG: hypothetical protein ACOYNX_10400 [Geothrix sp.]